jgi:hypothetical protein
MADEAQVGAATYPVTVISKLLDLTERQVHYHARNGVIPMPVKQRFDLVGCVQGYIRFLRKKQPAEGGAPTAKDRILTAKARQAEAEADLMDGTAIPKQSVEAAWITAFSLFRTRMLAIPARCSPQVEAAPDLAAINAILTGAIHDALSVLASGPVYAGGDAADRAGKPGGSDADGTEDADAAAEVDDFAMG